VTIYCQDIIMSASIVQSTFIAEQWIFILFQQLT